MALVPGTRLGPYEIISSLGAGGMGEVYRARDAKLDREVAVKVLSAHLVESPEYLARFEREAKAVAALSHPNILAIHDFGTHEGATFAAMELLDGETLRQRLSAGPLPPRKAIEIAVQIARGLSAAHEKGIVHRDLKPENVFVTKDGRIKILDFGLARQAVRADEQATTPTPAFRTETGTVMGTAGYMSPEQVRGATVDPRSDIFSFGAVLYEMLSGRPAFRRESAVETMTAVLREDPPELPSSSSAIVPALDRITRRCLEKRPEERFQSARDLAFQLESVTHVSAPEDAPTLVTKPTRRLRAVRAGMFGRAALVAAGLAAGLLAARWLWPTRTAAPPRISRLTYSGADSEPTASPDGAMLAFTSRRDGKSRIWIRQMAGGGEAPLTAGPDRQPRFAPDGAGILFVRDDVGAPSVYRAALVGGAPRLLVSDAGEADWSPDGRQIVFVRSKVAAATRSSVLGIADVQSGQQSVLAEVKDADLYGVRWSPDGTKIAAMRAPASGGTTSYAAVVVDVKGGAVRALDAEGLGGPLSYPAWNGGGSDLLFAVSKGAAGDVSGALARVVRRDPSSKRERTLFWAPNLFTTLGGAKDFARFELLGPGRLVFDEIEQQQHLRLVDAAASARDVESAVALRGRGRDRQPAFSPDGGSIVFSSNRSGNLDLWLLHVESGALRQITDDPAEDWDPAFSPDGKKLLWSSDRSGSLQVWMANADGTGERQVTNDAVGAENPTATRGLEWIVYASDDPNPARAGVFRIRPDGTGAARLVEGAHWVPDVSPDGRHAVCIQFHETRSENRIRVVEVATGRIVPFEISVPFPPSAANLTWGRARWMPDGRHIAFVGLDDFGRSGVWVQEFAPGRDTSATRRPAAGFLSGVATESFGVSPDGKRFALSTLEESRSLMLAEGVAGVAPPARPGR